MKVYGYMPNWTVQKAQSGQSEKLDGPNGWNSVQFHSLWPDAFFDSMTRRPRKDFSCEKTYIRNKFQKKSKKGSCKWRLSICYCNLFIGHWRNHWKCFNIEKEIVPNENQIWLQRLKFDGSNLNCSCCFIVASKMSKPFHSSLINNFWLYDSYCMNLAKCIIPPDLSEMAMNPGKLCMDQPFYSSHFSIFG